MYPRPAVALWWLLESLHEGGFLSSCDCWSGRGKEPRLLSAGVSSAGIGPVAVPSSRALALPGCTGALPAGCSFVPQGDGVPSGLKGCVSRPRSAVSSLAIC